MSVFSRTATIAACVSHAHADVTSRRRCCCCRKTVTTCDRRTAGFSVHGVFHRYGTNRQTNGLTDARPLYTRYLLDAASGKKPGCSEENGPCDGAWKQTEGNKRIYGMMNL